MTALRQAARQALEALQELDGLDTETECVTIDVGDVIAALKAALEQQAEPVAPKCGAIIEVFDKYWLMGYLSLPVGKHKLYTQQYTYTAPPQRQWVGLTDEDFLEACKIAERGNYLVALQRIQIKLKERNT